MSAWRWLWAWFGEPERPPRRQPGSGPTADAVPGHGAVAGGSARRAWAGSGRRRRRPLARATRAELERTLGADLADLSLTIDPGFTAALDARAVQVGSTIVLGDATDARSLPLLAHEAAHAVQARERGTRSGIGAPASADEHTAAKAAGAVGSGRPAPPAASGPPVAAIQRQPAAPGATTGAGERDSEAIRAMLMLAYAGQGGQGDFTWSDKLAAAFRRLLPGMPLARLEGLWEPPPKSPAEALARLQAAGIMAAARPAPPEPAPAPVPGEPEVATETPAPMPETSAAPAEEAELRPPHEEPVPAPITRTAGKALDATIVATLPRPLPEAFARAAPALRRGFRLDARQLRALQTDRSRAKQVYEELLTSASIDSNTRAGLADLLADLAWQSSVAAEGVARSSGVSAPGSPWRAAGGGLAAKGPFADLISALARLTEVTATLRFRP